MAKRKKKQPNVCACNDGNPFVAITAVTLGTFLGALVLVLVFIREMFAQIAGFAWVFAVIGVFALFFSYLASRKK